MGALRIFFEEARARQEDLVAAWIIRTEGSTYRKAGALMLFSQDQRAGLLSGGCLEGDLHEHARQLLNASTSSAALSIHRYDSRGSDDPVWGLGLGCEGLMEVLLLRCTANSDYQPLRNIFDAEIERRHLTCHIDLQSGEYTFSTSDINTDIGRSNTFSFRIEPRPHILICGAGPDVDAVVFFANKLAWQLTVVDHRPAYTESQRFGDKARICAIESADSLARQLSLGGFSAALVMSHHLLADTDYLIALTESNIPYIGLLGPAARRERLLSALGTRASLLQGRLRAPVGLDIGAQSAEEIALAIVAEIHASLRGRDARPFTTAIAHPYTR